MQSIHINSTKAFMSSLLKGELFDFMEVREVNIQTFISYSMNCKLNKDFFEDYEREELEEKNRDFCLWGDIRNFAFEIIKGKRTPKSFKIVLSLPVIYLKEIHDDASALFLNLNYDGKIITCITGCSRRSFTLDKTVDILWDEYIINFFNKNNVLFDIIE